MGHNCNTCKNHVEGGVCYSWGTKEFNTKEFCQDANSLHPCEHGTPIVASAVAGVEFVKNIHGGVWAEHVHNGTEDGILACWHRGVGIEVWTQINGYKFCALCGLLLPTEEQLTQLYERWQAEHDKH